MNGEILPQKDVVKFLGIHIDQFCKFDKQMEHIKSTLTGRLNILKIISHKSWMMKLENKVAIYYSLVRSVIEYSAFLIPILSSNLIKIIKTIQNTALRTILNVNVVDKIKICELESKTKVESIETRLRFLRDKYLKDARSNNNPLIIELDKDWENYALSRTKTFKSLFDPLNFDDLEQNAESILPAIDYNEELLQAINSIL